VLARHRDQEQCPEKTLAIFVTTPSAHRHAG
jgi:hypothetical protein